MSESGYSGTPLMKKLGARPGMRALFVGYPGGIPEIDAFDAWSERIDADEASLPDGPFDYIHVFVKQDTALEALASDLKSRLVPAGMVWMSWPKKASGVETTLEGNAVRRIGLDAGLVDIKVCAVDAVWSGLKFVIPVKDRKS
ncbi:MULTISPECIES: hypothetical protein [Hyphobacterium]|uniref:DUF3052 domain-containing protein n=1 Tax=Hyphobacterium vulgare TaxID=1736751 RepID=A0ABV6ZZT0_9PROT